jgi:hypothetical protein
MKPRFRLLQVNAQTATRICAAVAIAILASFGALASHASASAPLVVGASMPPAYEGSDYAAQIAVTGGTPPYTYTPESSLPLGLFLKSTGIVYGIAQTENANGEFIIKVTDSSKAPQSVTRTVALPIFPELAVCTPSGSSAATLAWLKGTYALELEQVNDYGSEILGWSIGTFAADGKGHITGGIFDLNNPTSSGPEHDTLTGTYAIGASGRGQINVTIPETGGLSEARSYCIAVDSLSGGVAGAGQMIEDDTYDTIAHGRFFAQGISSPAESSVKGSYVFGLQGEMMDVKNNADRNALAGVITLDGKGNVTAGQMDWSYDTTAAEGVLTNHYESEIPLSGKYIMASTGRGTMTLEADTSSGKKSLDFIFYVAGKNQILMLSSNAGYDSADPADDTAVVEGSGYLTATATFNKATLKGPSIITSQGLASNNGSNISYGRLIQAGIWTWDGNGNLTGNEDKNSAGSVVTAEQDSIRATYKVDSNGYAALSPTNVLTAPNFYLAGPNMGFGVQANSSVNLYQLENQTVPSGGFTAKSISGIYSTGSLWLSYLNQPAESGEITVSSSAGTFDYDIDLDYEGAITPGESLSVSYEANADGRFQTPKTGLAGKAIYIVSPKKAYEIDLDDQPTTTLYELNFFEP